MSTYLIGQGTLRRIGSERRWKYFIDVLIPLPDIFSDYERHDRFVSGLRTEYKQPNPRGHVSNRSKDRLSPEVLSWVAIWIVAALKKGQPLRHMSMRLVD